MGRELARRFSRVPARHDLPSPTYQLPNLSGERILVWYRQWERCTDSVRIGDGSTDVLGSVDGERLRQMRPPYVAFKTFDQFLRRAAAEEVPPRVDSNLLVRWKIAGGNESALITSLKSLGLIDADGRPAQDYHDIRLSLPRRQTSLRRCAKRAYAGLDGAIEKEITTDHLHDYFIASRGLLGQMLDKATRFYRNFEEMLAASARQSGAEGAPSRAAPASPISGEGRLALNVTVEIPFNASEAELIALFERVQRAWRQASNN